MTGGKVINYIDLDLMQKMCHPIAVTLFDSRGEPMTHFGRHDRALLESALNNPRQTFGGRDLYPTLVEKAAILYYSLIKNHAFENGNKRTATATLLIFLFINDAWITGTRSEVEDDLVSLAQRVAASVGDGDRQSFLEEIEKWLEAHINKGEPLY